MKQQHHVAIVSALTFLRTPSQVREYVDKGRLEPLSGNANYVLNKVSFPYARGEVRLFVERIAADFRVATGQALVVTSLTRPEALQPRNAHQLSVHPAGMAVDFRVPDDTASRRWLEATLLSMERTDFSMPPGSGTRVTITSRSSRNRTAPTKLDVRRSMPQKRR